MVPLLPPYSAAMTEVTVVRLLGCRFATIGHPSILLSFYYAGRASSGKRNVTVLRPSVCPSVCLSRWYTHRDSPGSSMRRGQSTFRPDKKKDRLTCLNHVYSQIEMVTLVSRLGQILYTQS